jgi:hypothetical protein
LLLDILEKGDATVLEEYPKYTQRLRVTFRCKCGDTATKNFEMLHVHGYPYCEKCSLRIKAQKCKETCLERYGVSNAGKLPEVIEKINNGFITKYGDHPKRTAEVQEKWKETCLLIYGGHPNQTIDVQGALRPAGSRASKKSLRHPLTNTKTTSCHLGMSSNFKDMRGPNA